MSDVPKNVTDLINKDVLEVYETDTDYYVKLKLEEYYDDSMWRVKKEDKSVEYVDYTWFLVFVKPADKEHARKIDPSVFKRAFS